LYLLLIQPSTASGKPWAQAGPACRYFAALS
jgi:hypothetical protein